MKKSRQVPSRSIVWKVEGYEPVCHFAGGGMAHVFLARTTTRPKKLVAIKTLRISYLEDPDRVAMFADEMRITQVLRHRNIVEHVEAGVIGGEPFIVLEFIDGPSLRELSDFHQCVTEGQPMDFRLATSLIIGVCYGLHYAHELVDEWGTELEIVHRDISPQNVMVTRGGTSKVLDFGVAKAVGQHHQTVGGGVKGKIAYAAPEYIRGTEPDRRADIFGLGVVLWELLANKRLFFKSTAVATMQTVVNDEAPSPRVFNPDVPESVASIVLQALNKDPEERIRTCEEMAWDLENALDDHGCRMFDEEISTVLARDYGSLIEDRGELTASMSDEELTRSAGKPSTTPDEPEDDPRRSDTLATLKSIEIDLNELLKDDPENEL